ncbi:3D domain-containing protein [Neomoorella humiferrea]|uniref:Cell wall-binding protein YocH n=1 Tax=Neomoorella humiferrea TaxID=676965 RepID=A0A2T0ATT3_9FIRM|nr:3D domain-containing protein [Moorella humiferrea]PRR73849.1 Cell wall-binding protein YocH precursor [Moorella humiferrea]
MIKISLPSGRRPAIGRRKLLLGLVCLLLGIQTLFTAGWTGSRVDIFDRGDARQVNISQWFFGEIAEFNDGEIRLGDWVLPLPGAWFWPGLKLVVAGGVPVAAEIAGCNLWPQVPLPTAAAVLFQEGITLGPEDRIESNLGSNNPFQYIRVIRVENTTEVTRETVPPPLVRRPERTLAPGHEKVIQEGQPGVRCYQYQVKKENGVEVERRLLGSWMEVQPQPRVVAYGSRAYPAVTAARAGDTLKVIATAYTHTGNRTATGIWPYRGIVAVDPRVIPLGTKLYVEGYGYAVAQDTGGLIKGNRIDVFLDSEAEAIQWGRRQVTVRILGQ